MILDIGSVTVPVTIGSTLATPGQWSADGFLFDEPDVMSWPGREHRTVRWRFFAEPGYFALLGAMNLAEAYRPPIGGGS